jgi:hypothetical protein
VLTRTEKPGARKQATALAAALCLILPLFALPAQAQFGMGRQPQTGQPRQGMSTGKKVATLAGAALLYYLWKRHNAGKQQQAAMNPNGGNSNAQVLPGGNGNMAATRRPQLYRSKNGGVYYRDAQKRPVWLTVPNRPVQVPVADLQRYAPDYARYRGPAPAAPAGYRTQSFGEFDPNLGNSFGTGSSRGTMSGGGSAPGPRG